MKSDFYNMCTLKISKQEPNLNRIENFIETICNSYNIQNSFHGNVIIAVTEIVSIVTSLGGGGKLIFKNQKRKFTFTYEIDSISADIKKIFGKGKHKIAIESNYEKSIFLLMALCDDLKIDETKSTISIIFKKGGIEDEISSHRKKYLKSYLGKTVESLS